MRAKLCRAYAAHNNVGGQNKRKRKKNNCGQCKTLLQSQANIDLASRLPIINMTL